MSGGIKQNKMYVLSQNNIVYDDESSKNNSLNILKKFVNETVFQSYIK